MGPRKHCTDEDINLTIVATLVPPEGAFSATWNNAFARSSSQKTVVNLKKVQTHCLLFKKYFFYERNLASPATFSKGNS